MKDRIVQLENRLQRRVQGVAFGAFFQEFEHSERGGKIIMGRHVTVYVPVSAYKPVMREQLRSAFQELHSDIVGVRLGRKTSIGTGDGLYRPVTLILARAQ